MENIDYAIDVLGQLRDRNITIAVDDFGTGYSSLTYLKRLPATMLKIDKQFIHDLMNDEESSAIVRSIIQLGDSLKRDVIAEGVETSTQLHYLRTHGCRWGQGYLFSKPLAPTAFEALWRAGSTSTPRAADAAARS